MNDIEKDKFVLIDQKNNIGTFVYIPSNYSGPVVLDATLDEKKKEEEK